MHFDEVYHARTATEFLQAWRYGESHEIYEWTHPHLAKYAMAGGLVLWGEDDVEATAELGEPVRAVAVEDRRDEGTARGGRRAAPHRDRRGHPDRGPANPADASRGRRPPASGALAVDPTEPRLILGADDGTISTRRPGPHRYRWGRTRRNPSS